MQFEDVETFITIYESGSISKAAESLYIGQGTASSRIKNLEAELGIELFFRKPGIRKITLTPEGETFLTIAKQWVSLQQQAENIKDSSIYHELRIASTHTINNSVFNDIYPYFTYAHPEISLYLQTEHSTEIHELIENQQVDIGFVNSLHNYPNVKSKALWKEQLVILCNKQNKFFKTHDLKDLDTSKEIYQTISTEYKNWHQRYFGNSRPMVSIGESAMIQNFIIYPDTWSIVHHTIANSLCLKHKDLRIVTFHKDAPPERITYLLTYKYAKPWIESLTDILLEEVHKSLINSPTITLLNEF